MRVHVRTFLAILMCLGLAYPATAQVQTGEITGRVTDNTGAILPGVTVTLSGPALLQPQTATTSETGSYQFARIPIGSYTVQFALPGFKTVVRQGVRVDIGFTAQINQQLDISTVEETVTVTGESPIVDTKSTTARTTFDLETLQNVPSARDPWVMLERVPNITMDRINVGGSQSGQQSGYISRGSGSGNNKWSLDGVDITDMSAVGASPIYYDFDMIKEMQVVTGGADASQQTGGVGINFVTRSGTDRFSGTGRFYLTDDKFEADNLTDEVKLGGVGGGAPIQNIKDYGFELGGPLVQGRLWYWGSYSKQDIKAGIPGFFLPDARCQDMQATLDDDPLAAISTSDVRSCLGTDGTELNNYNWKLNWAPAQGNQFTFQNTWAEKFKNARGAADTRPIETTQQQKPVPGEFGTTGWTVGIPAVWKVSDQHVFSDRFLVDVVYGHVGNNFALTFQDPSQRDVQATFDIPTGNWGRSFQESLFIRPTDSIDVTTSYFLPARLGGDHAFKLGYRWRTARAESINHRGGFADARFRSEVADTADLWRDGYTNNRLNTNALYFQDTVSMRRLTLNLGVRWDSQTDKALASSVSANPLIPDIMPGIDFPGADAGVTFNDVSPRLGLTYDLSGRGRSLVRSSYSMYFGQLNTGGLTSNLVSIGAVMVRYPWNDLNSDDVVQANELTIVPNPVKSAAFDPTNPTSFSSPGTVDPDVQNDRTQEFMLGFQQELMRNMGVEVNYIWRKYDRFSWSPRNNFSSSDFEAVSLNPANCSPQATCGPVTYYVATKAQPSPFTFTNQPDRHRDYNGVEMALVKRFADRWMANVSFAYNDAKDYWDSAAAYQDPTNIDRSNGFEFAPESGGSGIDNVFTNAKWLFKANGMYSLPWGGINVAGNLQYRQGYPFPRVIQVTNRGNGLGNINVLLQPMGDERHPNVTVLDFRIDRPVEIRGLRLIPSLDIFNLGNENTVLARRRIMYTYNHATGVGSSPSNAERISGIIAPRIIRFGVRVNW
jgi:hypothetical protein